MKRTLVAFLTLLFVFSCAAAIQKNSSSKTGDSMTAGATNAKKRGPIFRASQDQIKQAQSMLKQRNFYVGEQTGKLDAETRAGLKKYQAAENLKVTGTLNRLTLEKMNIALTDKQKAM